MRRLGFFVAYLSCSGALAACSILVDTKGLAGTADAAAVDGAVTAVDAEAGSVDGGPTAVDAASICDGGTTLTSFAGFEPTGDVVVTATSLTAVASTSTLANRSAALVRRDFTPAPSRVHLSYDLTLTRSNVLYVEPGCSVYLQNDVDLNLRQTFYSDHETLGQDLNIFQSDGGQEQRNTPFVQLPNAGPSTHHVDVDLTSSALDATISVTVDGKNQKDAVVLPQPSIGFFLRCGVVYADRYTSGSATESMDVTIANPSLTLCP